MSDLFNKLAMRRKGEEPLLCRTRLKILKQVVQKITFPVPSAGISGKGPAGGESADAPAGTGGAFARMSDHIPPLPAPHAAADDDDWEA